MFRPIAGTILAALLLIAPADAAKRTSRIKGTGETLSLKAFQQEHKYSDAEMRTIFGAVGRIRCPWGIGTAFLLGGKDVFVTSGHLFAELDSKSRHLGKTRGSIKRCSYHPLIGKGRYRIVPDSLVEGARSHKSAAQFLWSDWAVGRLERPIEDARPYLPGSLNLKPGQAIEVLSQGMNDTIPRICKGALDAVSAARNVLYLTSTCSAGPGASGGPVLSLAALAAGDAPRPAIGLTIAIAGSSPDDARHLAIPIDLDVMTAAAKLMRDPARVLGLAAFYKDAPGPPAQMLEIARGLYRIAAAGGQTAAYYWLGVLHFNTWRILPNDEIAAYGWLDLALEALPRGDPRRADAEALRDALAARLDQAQIERARGEAKALLASGG